MRPKKISKPQVKSTAIEIKKKLNFSKDQIGIQESIDSLWKHATTLIANGKLLEANEILENLTKRQPSNSTFLFQSGAIALKMGHQALAKDLFERTIKLVPHHGGAFFNLGLIYKIYKQFDLAIEAFSRATALSPSMANAHFQIGMILQLRGQTDEAAVAYRKVLQIEPNHLDALSNLGVALKNSGQIANSLEIYGRAIELNPEFAPAFANRGLALHEIGQFNLAIEDHKKAISLRPNDAKALMNLGLTYDSLRDFELAMDCFRRAETINPNLEGLLSNMGVTLRSMGNVHSAIACLKRSIKQFPNHCLSYVNLAEALAEVGLENEAIFHLELAKQINPSFRYLLGTLAMQSLKVCNWSNFNVLKQKIHARILNGETVTLPFSFLAICDSPDLQNKVAQTFSSRTHSFLQTNLIAPEHRKPGHKIRLGYFSSDFHNHATALLMARLFELHDKNKFEIVAFSFGPKIVDEMRNRLLSSFDKFIEVGHLSDHQTAILARDLGIDIAIDLKGYTQGQRSCIFANRAAPIQVNYLGYPGTMGVPFIDYIIADKTVIPPKDNVHYTEKIVYMPHCYQVNDETRAISNRIYSKRELGLPTFGFVFCCFNNNYKITPTVFDVWCRVITRVPDSVLWLLESNKAAADNLRVEAEKRGVESSRLVFAQKLPNNDHLARHKLADLFLDTFTYNAHTTASDALWTGLPVLTMAGNGFASRVAASLLRSVGMEQLITYDELQYENLAVKLAIDKEALSNVKKQLFDNLQGSPLFNSAHFTQNIEIAYQEIFSNWHLGLKPQEIDLT